MAQSSASSTPHEIHTTSGLWEGADRSSNAAGAPATSSPGITPFSASKPMTQGSTFLSQIDFALRVVGSAASRATLVGMARSVIDKSTPLTTSRSGGKRSHSARTREAAINFFMFRIREMIDGGEGDVLKPLMDAKGQDVRAAAGTLYVKMRQLMIPPNKRSSSTIRSRIEEWCAFQSESGTLVDRRISERRTPPMLQPGDADTYELATMLGWISINDDHMSSINDTTVGFRAVVEPFESKFQRQLADHKDSLAYMSGYGPFGQAMPSIRGGSASISACAALSGPAENSSTAASSATSSSSSSRRRRSLVIAHSSVPAMHAALLHGSDSSDEEQARPAPRNNGSSSDTRHRPKALARSSRAVASSSVAVPELRVVSRKRAAESLDFGDAAIAELGDLALRVTSLPIRAAWNKVVLGKTSAHADAQCVEESAGFARETLIAFVEASSAGRATSVMEEFTLRAIERLLEARSP